MNLMDYFLRFGCFNFTKSVIRGLSFS